LATASGGAKRDSRVWAASRRFSALCTAGPATFDGERKSRSPIQMRIPAAIAPAGAAHRSREIFLAVKCAILPDDSRLPTEGAAARCAAKWS
jgi:hypothetical protein